MSDENGENWYSADATTFGDRIVGAREATGMTQAELARRLGVKLPTVVAWEEDRSEPRANKLQMLAGLLSVSMRWLLTGEGDGLDAPVDETPISRDAQQVLTELRQLRTEMARNADRLSLLEKRLRAIIRDAAQ